MKIPFKKIFFFTFVGLLGLFCLSIITAIIVFHVIFKSYENKKEGFQIYYPRGWEVVEGRQPGAIVSFVSPKENPLDIFRDNVSITTTDLSKTPMTLDEYARLAINQTLANFSNVKFVDQQESEISDRRFRRLMFALRGEPPAVLTVYTFIENSVAYNFTYLGEADRFMKKDVFYLIFMMHLLDIKF